MTDINKLRNLMEQSRHDRNQLSYQALRVQLTKFKPSREGKIIDRNTFETWVGPVGEMIDKLVKREEVHEHKFIILYVQ
jgi:hypothetical protein